ncbi:MAG TPA: D-2-hydroxyacid dehydrogenase family protein [Anaerolineales bacterium]|nr:D-2-hydroxyacid dehydrogenase family protein [Anaerolineales bacterium]
MNKPKLLVMDDYEGELAMSPAMTRLRQLADVTILNHPIDDYNILKDFQILLALRERTKLDSRFFESCPALELVLQTGGHAYHVDQAVATQKGIVVALGRQVSRPTVVVPELALGFMLGLVRQIYPLTTGMSKGEWQGLIGGSLAGRTLGILGYGRHGRPVARLAEAFRMKVVAWDRTGSHSAADEFGVRRLPLDDLLAESDVISIHLRLSDESRGLLDRSKLWKMKPGAILINTSRGAIIDEAALIDALREKRLAGAGLDVFAIEPLPKSSPLRTMQNVLLTPHVGWQVRDVFHEFVEIAADQLASWLKTELSRSDVLDPEAIQVNRPRHGGLSQ